MLPLKRGLVQNKISECTIGNFLIEVQGSSSWIARIVVGLTDLLITKRKQEQCECVKIISKVSKSLSGLIILDLIKFILYSYFKHNFCFL